MPLLDLTPYQINDYRKKTFALLPNLQLRTLDMALDYINSRNLISFWPLNKIPCPSLWIATAGDRPVPSEHDDPGHITWRWKDELLSNGTCYYGRILCNRYFFTSIELLKYLYAMSENYGDPSLDHLILYEDGKISKIAFQIYDAILKRGALDTLALKQILRLSGKSSEYSFNQAMNSLQKGLKVIPVGISDSGSWHYAFVYDLVTRRFTKLVESAGKITAATARVRLIDTYLHGVGLANFADLQHFFSWKKEDLQFTLDQLEVSKNITKGSLNQNGKEITAYIMSELL
jgi:hypothetical protein